jgi:hypothetical protein
MWCADHMGVPRLALLLTVLITLLPVAPLFSNATQEARMSCCKELQAASCHAALKAVGCCRTPEAPVVATASATVSVSPERSVLRRQHAAPVSLQAGARTRVAVSALEMRQGHVAPLPPFLLDRALLL